MLATQFALDYPTEIGYEAAWFLSSRFPDWASPADRTISVVNCSCIERSLSNSNLKGNLND